MEKYRAEKVVSSSVKQKKKKWGDGYRSWVWKEHYTYKNILSCQSCSNPHCYFCSVMEIFLLQFNYRGQLNIYLSYTCGIFLYVSTVITVDVHGSMRLDYYRAKRCCCCLSWCTFKHRQQILHAVWVSYSKIPGWTIKIYFQNKQVDKGKWKQLC